MGGQPTNMQPMRGQAPQWNQPGGFQPGGGMMGQPMGGGLGGNTGIRATGMPGQFPQSQGLPDDYGKQMGMQQRPMMQPQMQPMRSNMGPDSMMRTMGPPQNMGGNTGIRATGLPGQFPQSQGLPENYGKAAPAPGGNTGVSATALPGAGGSTGISAAMPATGGLGSAISRGQQNFNEWDSKADQRFDQSLDRGLADITARQEAYFAANPNLRPEQRAALQARGAAQAQALRDKQASIQGAARQTMAGRLGATMGGENDVSMNMAANTGPDGMPQKPNEAAPPPSGPITATMGPESLGNPRMPEQPGGDRFAGMVRDPNAPNPNAGGFQVGGGMMGGPMDGYRQLEQTRRPPPGNLPGGIQVGGGMPPPMGLGLGGPPSPAGMPSNMGPGSFPGAPMQRPMPSNMGPGRMAQDIGGLQSDFAAMASGMPMQPRGGQQGGGMPSNMGPGSMGQPGGGIVTGAGMVRNSFPGMGQQGGGMMTAMQRMSQANPMEQQRMMSMLQQFAAMQGRGGY